MKEVEIIRLCNNLVVVKNGIVAYAIINIVHKPTEHARPYRYIKDHGVYVKDIFTPASFKSAYYRGTADFLTDDEAKKRFAYTPENS